MSKKTVKVGNITCGSDQLFLISGPCVIEDESIMMKTAEYLKRISYIQTIMKNQEPK